MGFAHVQGANGGTTTTGITSVSLTLPSPPTPGNLLVVAFNPSAISGVINTGAVVKDANNNLFTLYGPLPATGPYYPVAHWLGWMIAPSNASATINGTWAGSASTQWVCLCVDEFSYTGGTPTFDKTVAIGDPTNSQFITTPSITPIYPGSLLYGMASEPNVATVHPVNGEVYNGWTGTLATPTSDGNEYMLSSPPGSSSAYYACDGVSTGWTATIISISLTPSGSMPRVDMGMEGESIFSVVR